MIMINCACGSVFHEDWINIDFDSRDKSVKKVNLLKSLPFPDNYADVIYSSHFIEHLEKKQLKAFLQECYRVLRGGGNQTSHS